MRHREKVAFGLVLAALTGAQVSCGDSSGPGLIPTSISANSSTSLTAIPGVAVTEPPSVIVRDQNDAPLSGVAVTFAVTSGGGAVTGGTGLTNAAGVATVGAWILGSAGGSNTLSASSGNLPAVTFTATAVDPCAVAGIHPIGGTTNGELTPSDCKFFDGSFVDLYGTTVAAPGTYIFDVSSARFDTYLVLFSANSTPIGVNDDFGGSNSRIKAILPGGNYVIGANAFDVNATGAYTLTSTIDGGPVTNCEDVFVVRGITSPQTLQASDCPRVGGFYADRYFVFLAANQSITVSMNSATIDSYLIANDPGGFLLAQNDNRDFTTKDAQLLVTATVAGFYAITATSPVVGSTGDYTLIIQ
jgi:hypothetical protein